MGAGGGVGGAGQGEGEGLEEGGPLALAVQDGAGGHQVAAAVRRLPALAQLRHHALVQQLDLMVIRKYLFIYLFIY